MGSAICTTVGGKICSRGTAPHCSTGVPSGLHFSYVAKLAGREVAWERVHEREPVHHPLSYQVDLEGGGTNSWWIQALVETALRFKVTPFQADRLSWVIEEPMSQLLRSLTWWLLRGVAMTPRPRAQSAARNARLEPCTTRPGGPACPRCPEKKFAQSFKPPIDPPTQTSSR